MKKDPKSQSTRRRFLSLGLLGSASLITSNADAMSNEMVDEEVVKMLTPDGKLVEVKKSVLEDNRSGTKARNTEILKWSETGNKSK